MPELVYGPIPDFDRDAIVSAIERDDPDELLIVVLSVALHSDEPGFAESICVRLTEHAHFNVRGNALLGFAHLARIHGKLDVHTVKPLIDLGLQDEHEYVRAQALNAKDDIEQYLGRAF